MNNQVSDESLPSKSWEIVAFARLLVGGVGLQKIFKVKHAQVHRYAKDPDIFEDACQNPIDSTQNLLSQIVEVGGEEGQEVARIAMNLIGQKCGYKAIPIDPVEPTTDSPRAEYLELYNRLHELQTAAKENESPVVIEAYADKAKDALTGFVKHYTREFVKNNGYVMFFRGGEKRPKSTFFHKLKLWFLA